MRHRWSGRILLLFSMLFFSTCLAVPMRAAEQGKENAKMTLRRDVCPVGAAEDRTYRVELYIDGQEQSFIRDADVFLLLDMQAQMAGNTPVWAYYLRSVYNMCENLVTTYPERTFHFYFLFYNAGTEMIVNEKVTADAGNYKEALGDIEALYLDENGKPVYEDGQMHLYYRNPVTYQPETLLAYLQKVSITAIPGNRTGETEDDTGMLFDTGSLPVIHPEAAKYFTPGINTLAALEAAEEVIRRGGIRDAQIVLLNDTFPTEDVKSGPAYNGNRKKQVEITGRVYDKYEQMKSAYQSVFYMFGYEIFEACQFRALWEEYITALGNNLVREGRNGGYFEEEEYYPFTDWKPYAKGGHGENLCENKVRVEWDHNLGENSDEEQLAYARNQLNGSMLKVAVKVGNGLQKSTEYAYFPHIKAAVEKQFYILEDGKYAPKAEVVSVGEAAEAEKAVYVLSGERWKGQEIEWTLPYLSSAYESYRFVFYIRANEDYFGGETLTAVERSGICWLAYKDWFLLGQPETEEGIPPDRFQKDEIEGGKDVYVPWFFRTQNGKGTIFYGDSAALVPAEAYQNETYVSGKSNETENLAVSYYMEQLKKDRDGRDIEVRRIIKGTDKTGAYEETFLDEIISGAESERFLQVVPDTSMNYEIIIKKEEGAAYGQPGEWKPPTGMGKAERFTAFEEARAEVDIELQYGELAVTKRLSSESYSQNELSQFHTGFPVLVKGGGNLFQMIVRQGEKKTAFRLKRGVYTVSENVPQEFELRQMYDRTSGKKTEGETLLIAVGFEEPEKGIYQKHEIDVCNGYERSERCSSILEIKNRFETRKGKADD